MITCSYIAQDGSKLIKIGQAFQIYAKIAQVFETYAKIGQDFDA